MTETNLVTPELLKDIDRINADCIRNHLPPPPFVTVRLEIADIGTGEIEHIHTEQAHSFTRNWYNFFGGFCGGMSSVGGSVWGAGYISSKATNASIVAVTPTQNNSLYITAANNTCFAGIVNNSTYGIVIGTGTDAESFESYALGAQIAHGTSAGQMSHAASVYTNTAYDSGTKTYTQVFSRVFSNTSGGTIVVAETGMITRITVNGTAHLSLVERNLLGSTASVDNGQKITVTYTLTLAFPA